MLNGKIVCSEAKRQFVQENVTTLSGPAHLEYSSEVLRIYSLYDTLLCAAMALYRVPELRSIGGFYCEAASKSLTNAAWNPAGTRLPCAAN